MKKNILTIIIMAITLINTALLGVLIFTIVPTANKTTQLVAKVASIVDLELESPENSKEVVSVSDIVVHDLADKLTINLKKGEDGIERYALLYVSLTMNSKHEDYEKLSPKVTDYENAIGEIVTEEFKRYTRDEIDMNTGVVKERVVIRIQELFQSDFIINVSFGNMVLS